MILYNHQYVFHLHTGKSFTVTCKNSSGGVNHRDDEVHQLEDEAEHPEHHVLLPAFITWLKQIIW